MLCHEVLKRGTILLFVWEIVWTGHNELTLLHRENPFLLQWTQNFPLVFGPPKQLAGDLLIFATKSPPPLPVVLTWRGGRGVAIKKLASPSSLPDHCSVLYLSPSSVSRFLFAFSPLPIKNWFRHLVWPKLTEREKRKTYFWDEKIVLRDVLTPTPKILFTVYRIASNAKSPKNPHLAQFSLHPCLSQFFPPSPEWRGKKCVAWHVVLSLSQSQPSQSLE